MGSGTRPWIRAAGASALAALAFAVWGCREKGSGPGPEGAPPPSVALAAVGDILLDRGVAQRIAAEGAAYPFARMADRLSAADLTVGNLECPVSARGRKVIKPYSFRAAPETLPALADAGFDLFCLANNHTMDCGRPGLVETISHLKRAGLAWCGAGPDREAAERPTLLTVRGLRMAFLGYCDFLPEGTVLRDDRPTIAMANEERMFRAVSAARAQAEVVVVNFHWGVEYRTRPSVRQRTLARTAARAGADLVIGHHPHILQGVEVMAPRKPAGRTTLVAYSLGNFVFDQRDRQRDETVILSCRFGRKGLIEAALDPVRIVRSQPRPATPAEGRRILARLEKLSAGLDTRVTAGRIALDSVSP